MSMRLCYSLQHLYVFYTLLHLEITKPVPKQRSHVSMQESATSGDEERSPAPLECEDNGSFTYVPAITLKKTRESS